MHAHEIVFITGFTQSGSRLSGLEELRSQIYNISMVRKCVPQLTMYEWNDNMEAIAERMLRNRPLSLTIVGYSYGGSSAVRLAAALETRGVKVDYLALIDPVYRRFKYFPAPSSLLPWKVLDIPTNVAAVDLFYQRVNYPRGHGVYLLSPTTSLKEKELPVKHQAIDNADAVYIGVLGRALSEIERCGG